MDDLEAFTLFLRLAPARTATLINFSAVGPDVGVSYNTIRAWLSILETGFLCFRAPAWRTSLRKQLLKAARLHFFDRDAKGLEIDVVVEAASGVAAVEAKSAGTTAPSFSSRSNDSRHRCPNLPASELKAIFDPIEMF